MGASEGAASVRLPSGSVGCAQWGLCGLNSAECQARLTQASRQGGGGARPQGSDEARTLSSGRAWLAGLPKSPGLGMGGPTALSLFPRCLIPMSHPDASEGLQQPVPQGTPFWPRRHAARALAQGDLSFLWARLSLLPGGTEKTRPPRSPAQHPSCRSQTLCRSMETPPNPPTQERAGGRSCAFWEATHN